MSQLYGKNAVETLPPFGLSDRNVVIVRPTCRTTSEGPNRKVIVRRDTRPSRKLELGRYLAAIDWTALDSAVTCDDKLKLLVDTIVVGMDNIMPAKQFRVHYNDPPWITPEFKSHCSPSKGVSLREH